MVDKILIYIKITKIHSLNLVFLLTVAFVIVSSVVPSKGAAQPPANNFETYMALASQRGVDSYSIQEALDYAFQNNDRTAANELKIQAAVERTRAAMLNMLPNLNLSFSVYRYNNFTKNLEGKYDRTKSLDKSGGINIDTNIWRGFSDYYAMKAAESSEKALRAEFSSTNALIPNTKGAIAKMVSQSYFMTVLNRAILGLIDNLEKDVNLLKTTLTDKTNIEEVNRWLFNIRTDREKTNQDLFDLGLLFEFAVTMPTPNRLNTFEELMASMEVPATAEKAYEMAMEISPELLVSKYQLEEAEFRKEAVRRRIIYPSIDLSVAHGGSQNYDYLNPRLSQNGNSIGISISMNLAAANSAILSEQDKIVAAQKSDRMASFAELKFNLDSTYSKYLGKRALYSEYEKNISGYMLSLEQLRRAIENGENVDYGQSKDLIKDYANAWVQFEMMKLEMVQLQFEIQRIIGTLFDKTDTFMEKRMGLPSKQ